MNDNDLKAVISALESELNAAFDIAKGTTLAKAAPGEEPEAPPAEGSESAPPASAEASSPEPSASPAAEAPPAAPGGDVPPGASPDSGQPALGEGSGDPAADQLSPEALEAEYSQLPPDQLKMHIEAALKAAAALQGAGQAGGPPGAPPVAPPGAPGASPSAGPGAPPPAMKAELGATGTGGTPSTQAAADGGKMGKTEFAAVMAQFDNLKKALEVKDAQIKSQAEDVETLTKAVKMVLERPERKAVTGISYLKKAEPEAPAPAKKNFTAAEARAALNDLIPTLSKAERGLVLDYYEGRATIEKLSPILEKVK